MTFLLSAAALACAARLIWVDLRRLEIETPTLLLLGAALFLQSAHTEGIEGLLPRLLAAGARIVGGCCGSTPEHIAAMAKHFKK